LILLALTPLAGAQSTSAKSKINPHFQSAVELEHTGNVDSAIAEYRLAIKDAPDQADAHYNLGRLLEMQKGDHDGAIAEYRLALRIHPDDPDLHNNLGLSLKNNGDFDGAAREYREALRLRPGNPDAHINMGNLFYLQKNPTAAAAEYRAAIQVDPSNAVAHMSLGNTLDDNGDTDAAIAEYKEAVRAEPGNANAHYNLAICLAKKKDKDGAVAELRATAHLAPGWATPHIQLATLLENADRYAALEECHIAESHSSDPTVHVLCEKLSSELRAANATSSTKYPSQITLGKASGPTQSGTPQGRTSSPPATTRTSTDLFGQASALFQRHDYRNAALYYQQALDQEKQTARLPRDQWRVLVDNLAMSYGISGDLKRAQETLEYGLTKESKYPGFYYTLACVYAEKNDLDRTLANLKTAFQYRGNLIAGEHMPDPRTDDSFQRFKNDGRFQKLIASLPLN
jgi:Flp pilus assembly protein TadD